MSRQPLTFDQNKLTDLEQTVQETLAKAQTQGASAVEVALGLNQGLSVTARLGELETLEHHRDQGLSLTVYLGQRKGSASTNDLNPDSIQETVTKAINFARLGGEDEAAGLPEKDWLATSFPDLDQHHPWPIDADQALAIAIECEQAARAVSSEINNSEGASVTAHEGVSVFANSLGFCHSHLATRHSLGCSVLGRRGEEMQRDYWYTVARDAGHLQAAAEVGRIAGERTVKRLGARGLSTRQCPVLLAPEIARSLLGSFAGAISGGNLYRKSTFLLDAKDTRIFPEFIHIHEQPLLPGALASASYDAEGVATRIKDLVKDGVLLDYLLDTYSARKLGLASTGNAGGVHNMTLDAGNLDFNGLLKQMDTGLLVTELLGQGVNLVTGDYSRGAAGFWVERGEIQYPVEEITIAGNLKDMFQSIVAVGNDVDRRGSIHTGSILLANLSVAGS
ncbi:MAG: metalloprotease PmbA [Methylococcales bacterium]|nr:metalloprotease PmbA [Methylococcales bacterium]